MKKLGFCISLLFVLPLGVHVQDKDKKGLPAKAKSEITKLIKDYFEKTNPKDREDILKRVEEIEAQNTLQKSDATGVVSLIFSEARKGGRHNGKNPATCSHPDYPGQYMITVPSAAKSGGKVPLFIGLHGGGAGVGDGAQIAGLFGSPLQGGIIIYPTVIKKDDTAWNTEREEQYVLAIIDEMKRTYNIDTNRIYLAGHSMGGYGTWSIGCRHADLFAAIQPGAGGVFGWNKGIEPGIVENLKNTPIYFYHGSDDSRVPPTTDRIAAETLKKYKEKYGAYDYVYNEENGIGHGLPKEGLKPVWDWLFAKKRDPNPKFVIWEPTRKYKKLFYWVKIDPPGGRIEAKIEGSKITIDGSCSNVTVFLNDKLLPLDKEVTIVKGGKEVFKGKPAYSIAAALESIGTKNDPEMVYIAKIKIPD